jgi:hypothetical protein
VSEVCDSFFALDRTATTRKALFADSVALATFIQKSFLCAVCGNVQSVSIMMWTIGGPVSGVRSRSSSQ